MDIFYWIVIISLFILSFIGLIYPILPSLIFVVAGILLYGVFFSFEPFHWLFWLVQGLFILLLFGADFLANMVGVKKFGGSKAGVWGSTIGIIVGPFVFPVLGILLGPFIGAIIGEWLVHRTGLKESIKIGFGSVIGFLTSVIAKGLIQGVMIIYFFLTII